MSELESISYTRRDTLRRCPMKYNLKYNLGIHPIETSEHLHMGKAFSDALEEWDSKKVTDYFMPLIADTTDYTKQRKLQEYMIKTKVAAEVYMSKYDKPEVRELQFQNTIQNKYSDNGYIDGIEVTTDGITIIEDKYKSQWNEAYAKALVIDDQIIGYVDNLRLQKDISLDEITVKYRVTVKPRHKFLAKETAGQYEAKVRKAMTSDLDKYLHEEILHITEDQIEETRQRTKYHIMIKESCEREGLWPMHQHSCDSFGGCEYQKICYNTGKDVDSILANEYTLERNNSRDSEKDTR